MTPRAATPWTDAYEAILDAYTISDSAGEREFAKHHRTLTSILFAEAMRRPNLRAHIDDAVSELVTTAWTCARRGDRMNFRTTAVWLDRHWHRDEHAEKRGELTLCGDEHLAALVESGQHRAGRVRSRSATLRPLVHPPREAGFVESVLDRINAVELHIATMLASGYKWREIGSALGVTAHAPQMRMTKIREREGRTTPRGKRVVWS